MEEVLFKDKKYLTGVLTGFVLTVVILTGFNRYQQEKQEDLVPEEERENSASLDTSSVEESVKEGEFVQNEDNVEAYREVSIKEKMSPETPHSPELQRLALILREAERMLERMENDIDEVKETQTAAITDAQR